MAQAKITLYELPPSPNNVKVRLALNYKKLPFESRPLPQDTSKAKMAFDRTELIRVTGQPLTPALTHGDTVVYDSGAILRYLDGNFRDTPRLFSSDYATMQAIEDWERNGRAKVSEPVSMAFGQLFAETKDPGALDKASTLMHDATAKIEERLADGKWLVGDALTAADITLAPFIALAMIPADQKDVGPVYTFFRDNLKLGGGRDRTREWVNRTMAFNS